MPDLDLAQLAALPLDDLEGTLKALVEHRQFHRIDFWQPYPKQRDFIAMGAVKKQRLLTAGNQQGKSDVGAYEAATHLTGLYPKDWPGHRWNHPVDGWAASESTTVGRDVAQTKLCGRAGVEDALGTGFIPRELFSSKPTLARGAVADAYDTIQVYHVDQNGSRDGVSTLQFKSYEQGRKKFQGSTHHFNWWDEEPPEDIYTEGEARWSAIPDGRSWMTFTPLQGMSTVVLMFYEDTDIDSIRGYVNMGIKDCLHMTPDMAKELLSKYPVHEHEARLNGEPLLGSGRIFQTNEKFITFSVDLSIPAHWPLLWGIDFGITHPFAAVLSAWDRDLDIIYLVATYRAADALPLVHSEAIRRIGANVPVAWPHDGARREAGSGENLAKVYKALDLKMLPTHAHYAEGGYSTEAAILEMQQRFGDGRLRVREDLEDFLGEYRMYHRKDGMIVKVRDDLISATQKIMMMKRHARVVQLGWTKRPDKSRRHQLRPTQAPPRNPWTGREVPKADRR